MLVGPRDMLVGPNGWKRHDWLGRFIQDIESLDCPMGIIPKFIKVRVKGKSLSGVIDPRRLPITRWVCKLQLARSPLPVAYGSPVCHLSLQQHSRSLYRPLPR